ncbi:MAG: hypothetical protein IJ711_06580 [Lachnospiraceae bacterium]|nr:hypothetical protein [Lachnospiraceae bacterium]
MVHKILQILNTLDTVKSLSPLLDLMKQMQTASDDSGSDASSAMPDISSLLQMGDLFGSNGNPELFGMFESFLHAADAGGGDAASETADEKT